MRNQRLDLLPVDSGLILSGEEAKMILQLIWTIELVQWRKPPWRESFRTLGDALEQLKVRGHWSPRGTNRIHDFRCRADASHASGAACRKLAVSDFSERRRSHSCLVEPKGRSSVHLSGDNSLRQRLKMAVHQATSHVSWIEHSHRYHA